MMVGALPIPVFCLTRTGLEGKEHISFDSFVACFKDNEVGVVKDRLAIDGNIYIASHSLSVVRYRLAINGNIYIASRSLSREGSAT